ncbi:MAG TPA: Kazal-type serine protease inhibitor domain-containing protein [Thermoanaerobaculia bacterium]|nr:Kazal-type serine protease inhibitor domain-containing protein [Thermoanaerobaculia bacterium]
MHQRIHNHVFLGLVLTFVLGFAAFSNPLLAAGETCGGIGGLKCAVGEGCLYPAGQCNQPDLAGKCVVVPDPCPTTGPQICGCDGKTYANQCEIAKAGVRPDHNGKCK